MENITEFVERFVSVDFVRKCEPPLYFTSSRSKKNAVFWDVTLCAVVRFDVSEDRQFLQELHYVTSQKTGSFLVTTVKT
jgi:hypothetical protein